MVTCAGDTYSKSQKQIEYIPFGSLNWINGATALENISSRREFSVFLVEKLLISKPNALAPCNKPKSNC